MLNFSKNAVFNLKKIDNSEANRNALTLLIDGEELIGVYKTVRDQVIFTNKRIINVDVQGITGKLQQLVSMPYSNVQYYSVQTAGFAEINADAEMSLFFNNGEKADYEFKGKSDIFQIGKMIGTYVLAK